MIPFPETYRYKETPIYTASNGCPVRSLHCLFLDRQSLIVYT
jgi:hypothetical protein